MSKTQLIFTILVIFAVLCSIATGILIRHVLRQAEREEQDNQP